MIDKFESIRPYTEEEALSCYNLIAENQGFKSAMEMCLHDYSIQDLKNDIPHFKSIQDFQIATSMRFIATFIKGSTSNVVYSGIDHLDKNEAYLFIGNHRDIAFDSALLQEYFYLNNFNTTKIAIGDNLITNKAFELCAKLNKMFLVKRSLSIREKILNYQLLSEYIYHSIVDEKESVWIAQRDGRTKDGLDQTKQGLVKMFTMCSTEEYLSTLQKLKIVPISVSYEYEPCDNLKARELALSENSPYKKKEGEDFESIKQGIFKFKGTIHLSLGTPITDELNHISNDLNNNDRIYEVCKLIDNQIYSNYHLYPNNYIAFDLIDQQGRFADYYTKEQKKTFMEYLNKQAIVEDVPYDKMMYYLLRIYANPITTCLKINYNNK